LAGSTASHGQRLSASGVSTSGVRTSGVSDTVPKLLLRNADLFPGRQAMRHKDLGIWQTYSWGDMRNEIRLLALGLRKLGFERGDRIAIIGNNRPRLYWTFCAAQSLGGVPVPLYQDSVADEMAYVLGHAEVKFALVHDQEQVDKIVTVADRVPTLTRVIYDDTRGLKDYDPTHLSSYNAVRELGAQELAGNPAAESWWLDQIALGKGSDISVMLYTSGTTGRPKGVMLSHDNVVKSGQNANLFDRFTADDTMLAYLPMAWVGDHIFTYGQAYAGGICVACPESPETAVEDRREIGPTYFFAPPRVFESMLTQMTVRMEDASKLKQRMHAHFMRVAREHGENVLDGKPVSAGARIQYWLGDKLVYAPLRNRMGFSKLRLAYTAGEAVGPELFRFYRSIGINLKQLYGQTEASVFVTLQPDGEVYPDTVGKPGPDVEIKIADSGEVMFRSPGVFVQYYKNDEATASTKTPDGWVHSGDAGFIDARGHLVIMDRAKDVGKLTSGAVFSPKYLENRLKFFPEIKEAVAFGHGRDFVSMFINIDLTSVGNWAERNGISYASYQELAGHPKVLEMVAKRVGEMNKTLSTEERMKACQIKRFIILTKELEADDGELTRTQKVRRSFIEDRYAPLVKALYNGSKTADISVEVVFEDGRKGKIEGHMQVLDAQMFADTGAPVAGAPVREVAA
jgi:long-chain acyl-CoA synthetase